jgi:hypothetical protein
MAAACAFGPALAAAAASFDPGRLRIGLAELATRERVELTTEGGALIVALADELVGWSSTALSAEASAVIDRLAAVLAAEPGWVFEIVGPPRRAGERPRLPADGAATMPRSRAACSLAACGPSS